jgi:hypothetical protein
MMSVEIGKIIRGESHTLYWVQVHNKLESSAAPKPEDCAFGTFVSIPEDKSSSLTMVGVIVDTMLIDRDALRAGPRLSPDMETTTLLFPDFIDEKIKIVRIMLIGYIKDKKNYHNFPDITPNLGESVRRMQEPEIEAFHLIDGHFQIGYYSLMDESIKLYMPLLRRILGHLIKIFPHEKVMINLLINNLEYRLKLGGGI